MKKMNQKGLPRFAVEAGQTQVLILAGIIILLAVAGGIFYLGRVSAPKPQNVSTSSPQPRLDRGQPSPTLSPTTAPNPIINLGVLSSTCGFTIQYPKEFDAQDRNIIKQQAPSASDIDSICVVITAPDYIGYLGEDTGLIIRINRFRIGDKVNATSINSIDDYVKAVGRNQPVGNEVDKTYGNLRGRYFTTSGYFVDANFVFIRQNYLYEISWDSNYDGQYKIYVDQILSTFKFLP